MTNQTIFFNPNGKQSCNKRKSDSLTYLTILETKTLNVLDDLAENAVVDNLQLNKQLFTQKNAMEKLSSRPMAERN